MSRSGPQNGPKYKCRIDGYDTSAVFYRNTLNEVVDQINHLVTIGFVSVPINISAVANQDI